MISSPAGATACFVYLTLPGETDAVTAGRFELTTSPRGVTTGRFVHGRNYLARPDAVEIDPVDLTLGDRTREPVRMDGLFGALRDAGPDHWGRRVIERRAGVSTLGELDYLLNSPDDRAGALGFGPGVAPPAPLRRFNRTLDLGRPRALAEALIDGDSWPPGIEAADLARVEDLLLLGTSMGGARPKTVVEDDAGLWLAKFNRQDDRWNMARVEHAMLTLGRARGPRTAESRVVAVGDRDALLVKRFDRERTPGGYRRARMVSALTLLRADESPGGRDRWSYVLGVGMRLPAT